jgi:hypothetical protein
LAERHSVTLRPAMRNTAGEGVVDGGDDDHGVARAASRPRRRGPRR